MNAADDSIELVCREKKQKTPSDPDHDQVVRIDLHIEGTEESRGNLAAERSEGNGESALSRVDPDGAAERANRVQTRDIYWYIWEDDEQAVKDLVSRKDRQVKLKDSHGYAPVHYAAKFNRPEIMRKLVDGGADIKAKTVSEGYTPLHLAACYLRHACKPCKSAAKPIDIIEQPETSDQPDTSEVVERSYTRTQSDTGTLELPKHKYRRRSSAPPLERQTSCKEIFEFLVERPEIDVNAKDRYGFTPLHIACQSGNKEAVVSLLSRKEIDVTVRDGNGDTPLHEACFHGHQEIVEILLGKMKTNGAVPDMTKVNIKNNAGLTPFHFACREDHYKIVKLLLDTMSHMYKDLLKECDNDKSTPLHYACQNDSINTVILLMNKSSNIYEFLTPETSDGVTPMHVAAQYGCVKVMEKFLEKSENARIISEVVNVRDTYNQTPLHYATEYGKTEMMTLLLNRGADIEAEDIHSYTPVLTAAEYGQVKGFELLLNKEAKLLNTYEDTGTTVVKSKDRKTALFLAAEHNHPKIIEIILTKRSTEGGQLYKITDTSFNTCLHIAAQNGHLECVKVLWNHRVKLGLKLQTKNALLKTAMHLAAENGHNHIVTELQHFWKDSVKDSKRHEVTDVGRLLKSVDDDGNTPLHLACKQGFIDVAKTLIKMPGADIGARNKVLWTPLDCAAANGHARIVKELVSAKVEIDPTDKLKTTPLHLAAKEGHVIAVETLIKHGANAGLRDQRGFNALDWAIEKGHRDVAEAIISSPKWKLALRNCTKTQDGRETTPFRKLIQRMPDVAQLVLKKCTSTNAKDGGISPDCKDYAVTFSYEFIEDSEEAEEWKAPEQNKMESDDEKHSKPAEGKSKKKQTLKHPLRVMVESKRTELLKHPLIYSLIDHKWRYEMVMVFFYLSLVCYLLFAIFLTTFALKLPNPLSPICTFSPHQEDPVNISQLPSPDREAVTKFLVDQNITISADGSFSREVPCSDTEDSKESLPAPVNEILCGSHVHCPPVQSKFLTVALWIIVAFCVIRVIRKLLKCRLLHLIHFDYRHIGSYIDDVDLATLVKIPLIVCTLIFISGVWIHGNRCLCPLEWQWQVGIAAVFLAWADLVLYMRKLRLLDTGLYVLMFQSIFKTFVRAMILTIVLVVMFALAFHMTFNHFHSFFERSPFTNMLQSTWKTMTMTTGEMGYEDIFHQASGGSDDNIPPIPFPEISYILWVIFLILMPILFTNLLVGLAVDDIKGIQEAATLKRLEMRVDLILALDREILFRHMQNLMFKLPERTRRFFPGSRNCQSLHEQRELTIYPNKPSFYSFVPKFLIGENYSSAEHLSLELNPTKTPADQVSQTLMWEISKIQEMLLSMNEGLREVKERIHELSEEKTKGQATHHHDGHTQGLTVPP